MRKTGKLCFGLLVSLVAAMAVSAPASAQQQKPNILVIMGDDIGWENLTWGFLSQGAKNH